MEDILDEDFLIEKSELSENRSLTKLFTYICAISFLISTILSWYKIESIILTGPILNILGLVLFYFSNKSKNKTGMLLGLIPIIIVIIWFSTIYVLSLSPKDCKLILPLSLSIILIGYFIYAKDAINKEI